MVANISNAIAAYSSTAARTKVTGMAPRDQGPSFTDLLEEAGRSAIDTMKKGEEMTAKAVIGQANLTDVVSAVSSAELTLQTVTTVRDRVVNAYQEIMKMPI